MRLLEHQRWASLSRYRTSERQHLGPQARRRLSFPEKLHLESLDQQRFRLPEHQLEQQHHMGSLDHRHLGPPERQLRNRRQGSTDRQTSASSGIAPAALELRPRLKLNIETGSELEEIHTLTLADGQPQNNSAAGPLDVAHGGGEPAL